MLNKGRFVNVLDKLGRVHSAFLFSEMVEGNGIELLVPIVDSQSNEVTWEHSSRNRHGKEFVEIDEDVEVLRIFANENRPKSPDEFDGSGDSSLEGFNSGE